MASGVAFMNAAVAHLVGLDWVFWTCLISGIVLFVGSAVMAIRQTWFPRKRPAGLKKERPELIAEYDTDLERGVGVLVQNVGDAVAYDVSVVPIQLGPRTLSFSGPEVPALLVGSKCFFNMDSSGPQLTGVVGNYLAALIRHWKTETCSEIDPTGCIQYGITPGSATMRAKFQIGIDVLAGHGVTVRMK